MKKLICCSTLALCSVISVNALAYNLTVTNDSDKDITLTTGGGSTIVDTFKAHSTSSDQLDAYTTYMFKYQGTWAPQGLGTIQKNTNMVYQITADQPASGRIPYHIVLDADGKAGSVNNLQPANPTGVCGDDSGGQTCNLALGDTLQSLNISFNEANAKSKS